MITFCVACEILKKGVENLVTEEAIKIVLCSCCTVIGIKGISEVMSGLAAKAARKGVVKGIEAVQ